MSGPRVVDADVKARMKDVLTDIQTGEFAKRFSLENQAGNVGMHARRRAAKEHQLEEVGDKLRSMMPWIAKNRLVDKNKH